MKHRFFLAVILICFLVLIIEACLFSSTTLHVSEQTHDFGWVRGGSQASVTILAENKSMLYRINLLRIENGCGCTSVVSDRNSLAPRSQSEITASISTTPEQSGFDTFIDVVWSVAGIPMEHHTRIGLRGHVSRQIAVSPSSYQIGRVDANAAVQNVALSVTRISGEKIDPWDTLKAQTDHANVQLKTEAVSGNRWKIEVQFDPKEQPIGRLMIPVTITCSLGNEHYTAKHYALIAGKISSDVYPNPDNLYVGSISAKEQTTKTIKIQNFVKNIKLISVASSDPQFADVHWHETDRGTEVVVVFKPQTQLGQKTGVVTVSFLEDDLLRQISVPYEAYVAH